MKKYLIAMAVFTVIGYVVYLVSSFELFPIKEKFLIEFRSVSSGNRYKILFIGGTATTEDVIRVINQVDEKNFKVIVNIAGYDTLTSTRILDDSLVQLVLRDSKDIINANDTLIVNLLNGKFRSQRGR